MIQLCPLREFRLPIVAECISPDVFQDKDREQILSLEVWEGNKRKALEELFRVEEFGDGVSLVVISGNVSKVRRIGAGMTSGEIRVEGNVGTHLGEEMKGGRIAVNGDVAGWAGSMMRGGEIEIHGNVSDYLGAPYRGSTAGINGGQITVYGNVRNEAGAHMKKGLIKIHGNAGQFVGFRMQDGTIYVKGSCESRAGACMAGGKIIVSGELESVLPTFAIDGLRSKVKIEEGETVEEPLYVFLGDLAENGNGKLYVSKERNSHLRGYEKFI